MHRRCAMFPRTWLPVGVASFVVVVGVVSGQVQCRQQALLQTQFSSLRAHAELNDIGNENDNQSGHTARNQSRVSLVQDQSRLADARGQVGSNRSNASHNVSAGPVRSARSHVKSGRQVPHGDEWGPEIFGWARGYRDIDVDATRQALGEASDLGIFNVIGNELAAIDEGAAPKIAFLFLVLDNVEHEDVWDKFFQDADHSQYSVYVHRARPWSERDVLGRWGASTIPQVPSEHCALTGVEAALLSHALQDKANTQFVFVSADAIPLKPFHYIHSRLIDSKHTSKFCYFSHKKWGGEDELVLKHHQWVVLNRRHSLTFLNNVLPALNRVYPLQDRFEDSCSDETAVSTSLVLVENMEDFRYDLNAVVGKLAEIGVEQQCTTWVYWGHDRFGGTPLDLNGISEMPAGRPPMSFSAESGVKAEYLDRLVTQEGFMFARKFLSGAVIDNGSHKAPLVEHLPGLWGNLDEGRASSRVWRRLDASGQP